MGFSTVRSLIAFAAVSFAGAASLSASSLYVNNFSFEQPANSPGNAANDQATGYNIILSGQGADYTGTFYPNTPGTVLSVPDGHQVLFTEFGFGPGNVGVSQNLVVSPSDPTAVNLAANTAYKFQVDVGRRADGNNESAGYSVVLLAGGSPVATLSGSTGVIPVGTFANEILTYNSPTSVTPGQQLGVEIVQTSGPAASTQVLFDNVRVDATALPEPGTLTLVAVAGTLLTVRRRRA